MGDNKELSHTRQIVDFRNRLIHSYDNIDDTIVWVVIKKHIPTLKEEVQQELGNE
ncbi:MAG: HepT-like ribonuclease domain-containing protein [Bacteroidota bacterium]